MDPEEGSVQPEAVVSKKERVRIPEFDSGRESLVIEVGPAGTITPRFPKVRGYLKERGANYVGYDPSPIEGGENGPVQDIFPWAKLVVGDVREVEAEGIAQEVWMRNTFRGVKNREKVEGVLGSVSSLLEEGGQLIFWDTYSRLGPEDTEYLMETLKEMGFSDINREKTDDSQHPFVEVFKIHDEGFNAPNVLITAKKKASEPQQDTE